MQFSLVELWLRTDIHASWSKLAAALDEAGEDVAAGRVKEEYLGVPASTPITAPTVTTHSNGGEELRRSLCVGLHMFMYMCMYRTVRMPYFLIHVYT